MGNAAADRLIERFVERARRVRPLVVFPEGDEPRIAEGALLASKMGACRPILLGPRGKIEAIARERGLDLGDAILREPATDPALPEFAAYYSEARRAATGKEVSERSALKMMGDPLYFGSMLAKRGDAKGMVAGARETTAKVATATAGTIGLEPGIEKASSSFLMVGNLPEFGHEGAYIFSDPAFIPDPTPEELAQIAVAAAGTFRRLFAVPARVALLSFSTAGSARHPLVDKVREAGRLLAARAPELLFDVEVQADAAIIPSVAAKKHPENRLGGRANTLVFPDLNAGNIAYKLVERLCGFQALGPFIQGIAAPVSDLSRGCTADDVAKTAAIVANMAVDAA